MSDRIPLQPVAGLSRTADIPPPPRRRPTIQAAPEPQPPAPASPAGEQDPATPTKTVTQKRRARASDQADVIRRTTLSMPVDVLEALKTRATTERVSQPDVLMDALSATRDQLEQLVGSETQNQNNDGLFLRRTTPENATPLATLSLRMLARNIDAIDDLAASSGAKSRSALCAAALRHYLKT